mmetsp:Transcript_100703/g.300382  ORF Transcript_100703/g.300382 Transcript_100703/m.300382 type:complete len:146 (+) Transcript_100703:240-677(+)
MLGSPSAMGAPPAAPPVWGPAPPTARGTGKASESINSRGEWRSTAGATAGAAAAGRQGAELERLRAVRSSARKSWGGNSKNVFFTQRAEKRHADALRLASSLSLAEGLPVQALVLTDTSERDLSGTQTAAMELNPDPSGAAAAAE